MQWFKKLTLTCALCALIQATGFGISLSNKDGRVIEVELLEIQSAQIKIRLANGQAIWYDRALLSTESQATIAQQEDAERDQYRAINELLGIPLFNDSQLWDDTANAVAERLGWRLESKTDSQSSYRTYPKPDYRILSSRPYSAVLYGENDRAQHLSIVFANKGDFKFSETPTESEIRAMESAIDDDAKRIESLLSKTLGSPDRQQFGAGRGIKQLIERWDWKGHAFLLASQDGEYVSLKIMTAEAADNKGRAAKLSDAALRGLTTENIITRPNGDVLVGNIPMVNQGPKGYCVPATFERYLRYMQIPADMYILAMAGQTSVGGGTSLSAIISSIDGYIASQSRSMKQERQEIKVRNIQKHIDKGLPIIWTLFSTKEYNDLANQRTKDRRDVTDWEQWTDQIKSETRGIELQKDYNTAHACMIIGYNKDTNEIAVSDSWGPSYQERWISAELAEQVSQGSIYIIGF
ncbi:MAG: C39 family peptidase [Opitutaceae bacterium]